MRLLSLGLVLLPALAVAQEAVPQPPPPPPAPVSNFKPLPTDAECKALPQIKTAHVPVGEMLDYDIDVLAANAARMEVETLPKENGVIPIRVRIKTNTFFNKVRRVKAEAKSYLNPKSVKPSRYTEDAWEDDSHKVADVNFKSNQGPQSVVIRFATNPNPHSAMVQSIGRYGHDALDELGAVYYIRSMDLKAGMPICFDVYAMRHMFRVWGTVGDIEKVTTPAGEFQAWHITGTAARLDDAHFQRELHVWITADDRRLPIGALGAIDLGTVRATLTHIGQPGGDVAESHAQGLDW